MHPPFTMLPGETLFRKYRFTREYMILIFALKICSAIYETCHLHNLMERNFREWGGVDFPTCAEGAF